MIFYIVGCRRKKCVVYIHTTIILKYREMRPKKLYVQRIGCCHKNTILTEMLAIQMLLE